MSERLFLEQLGGPPSAYIYFLSLYSVATGVFIYGGIGRHSVLIF